MAFKFKSPKALLSDYIIAPASRAKEAGLNLGFEASGKIADFIFDKSKETDLIMLVFNAIAIYSSHTAQIHGLQNSNRENKDFLIEQEKKERTIDLFLTVIPPFLLRNFLSKKLETGLLTTKSLRQRIIKDVGPSVGAMSADMYQTNNVPVSEVLMGMLSKVTNSIVKHTNKVPKPLEGVAAKIKQFDKTLAGKIPDRVPKPTYQTIACRFDDRVRAHKVKETSEILEKLRNGRASDEISGQISGILVLASCLYTVLASNVLMPYLKNKLTNKEYERGLKEKGETRESMRRKRRYEYTTSPVKHDKSEIFNVFSNSDNTVSSIQSNASTVALSPLKPEKASVFTNFNLYSDLAYNNKGLKI